MITVHSKNLKLSNEACCAEMANGGCRGLSDKDENCRTYKCKFYKPIGCKDWVRIDDRHGSNLIPPEELKYKEKL